MFIFFKQKTAYEMRISDWSSDVCSSDLIRGEFKAWAGDSATVPPASRPPAPAPAPSAPPVSPEVARAHLARLRAALRDPCPAELSPGDSWAREPSGGAIRLHSDRKSVVSGQSVSGRVELGGRRNVK